ncbi:hypothetical protein [Shewanella halifaxensis]|uniref:hypothetical protein n=1 Tax=Shewanella halifaxensis TaxID=271098 RepID=UPI0013A61408|nr:hypothetical protein [Shewanella halifaxensis]
MRLCSNQHALPFAQLQTKPQKIRNFGLVASFTALLATSIGLQAEEAELEVFAVENVESGTDTVVIPIVGAMESTGALAGSVIAVTGVGQPQAQAIGFGAYSVNDSYISYLGYFNYALSDYWTFDISGLIAEFTETAMFLGEQPDNPADIPSDASLLQRDWQMTFRYLMSEQTVKAPTHNQQSPLGGHADYNTRTVLEIEPFYHSRDFRSQQVNNIEGLTYGVSMKIDRDARNYAPSPSAGYHSYAKVLRDWGNADRASYTRWEAQHTHYFDLGNNGWNQQQTLSVTGYVSDIPTWKNDSPKSQPDWFAQSTLGGSDRMRGYGDDYFHNRSALFYGAEYRVTPNWQPQTSAPLIEHYNFPWWQFAAFAEVGSVDKKLDLVKLHKDMHWSAGVGLRVFIENIVARVDYGFSKDDSILRFTVNQAF